MNFDQNSDHEQPTSPEPNSSARSGLPQYASPQSELHQTPVMAEPVVDDSYKPLSWSGFLAWAFVLGLSGFMIAIVAIGQYQVSREVGGDAAPADLMQIQVQAKVLVGQESIAPGQAQNMLAPELDSGSYEQRICYSVLVNELKGPTEALEHLKKTDEAAENANLELTKDQTRLRELMYQLMQQYEEGNPDSGSLPEADQQFVKDKLQWIGELALLPSDSPNTTARNALVSYAGTLMFALTGALLFGGLMLLIGFGISVVFAALVGARKLRSGFYTRQYDHNIYIETFAIWMGLFFGSSIGLSILNSMFNFMDDKISLMIQPFVFFGSLVALVWPIVRGISFKQMRKDIGWTSEKPAMNLAASVPAYLATIPYLLPCVVFVVVMMSIIAGSQDAPEFSRQAGPSHPIQEEVMLGGTTTLALVFITACICAPVVEETMFRGVLYRHLRDITGKWRRWASVVFAAVLNGLIFAAIHPQGLFGIPMLTMLAIGFSLTREWRGSLVSSMVMHLMHNALVTCVMLTIL